MALPPAFGLVRMRSLPRSPSAAWARCIGRRTRSWIVVS